MAPLPRYLLFLDFETTSLDPATTWPLEVFWELTDWSLAPVASGHGVRPIDATDKIPVDDFVRDMHTKSGLLGACDEAYRDDTIAAVTQSMGRLANLLDGIGEPVALAGSGVASFDRLIINNLWPNVAKHLTYWALDMGPIRRLAEGTGYAHLGLPADDIAHRAEADVRRAQDEFRNWVKVFDAAEKGGFL